MGTRTPQSDTPPWCAPSAQRDPTSQRDSTSHCDPSSRPDSSPQCGPCQSDPSRQVPPPFCRSRVCRPGRAEILPAAVRAARGPECARAASGPLRSPYPTLSLLRWLRPPVLGGIANHRLGWVTSHDPGDRSGKSGGGRRGAACHLAAEWRPAGAEAAGLRRNSLRRSFEGASLNSETLKYHFYFCDKLKRKLIAQSASVWVTTL